MTARLGELITTVTVPFVLLFALVEWLYARHRGDSLHDRDETVSNFLFSGFALAFELGLRLGGFFLYRLVAAHSPVPAWTLTWPVFVFTFIFSDFLAYASHRVCHEVNLLWAAHLVHHQPTRMNLTVAFRTSLNQRFVNIGIGLVAGALNLPFAFYFTSLSVITIYTFWCHTEYVRRMPIFEWFFVTPAHHRVHHATNPQYLDRNYGNVFIVWDRLFGTFAPEVERPVYGLTAPLETTSFFESYFRYPLEVVRSGSTESLRTRLFLLFASPARIAARYPDRKFDRPAGKRRVDARDAPADHPFLLRNAVLPFALYLAGLGGLVALNGYGRDHERLGIRAAPLLFVASIAVASAFYFALKSYRWRNRNPMPVLSTRMPTAVPTATPPSSRHPREA